MTRRAVLIGTGSALPERLVDNAEMASLVDTSDDWIVERTGIRQRYLAGPEETTSSLAIGAARAALEAAVAIRVMLLAGVSEVPGDPGLTRVLRAAAEYDLPVNLLCWERLEQAGLLAARHPNAMLAIDHLGLRQPIVPPVPAAPFADLPSLLALASHENITLKISGVCTMSREVYPYDDLWTPLGRIFDAFTLDRCMWGTDWTRAVALLTYKEGVDAFRVTDRLSDSDRVTLMGGALQKIYGWSPKKG